MARGMYLVAPQLLVLELRLGGGADLDAADGAPQLRNALLALLLVELRVRGEQLRTDRLKKYKRARVSLATSKRKETGARTKTV